MGIHPDDDPGFLRRVLTIVAVALAIRMVVVYFTYAIVPDGDTIFARFGAEMGWVGRALATGHGFSSPYFPLSGPTARVPPLYPWLLAAIFRVFGLYTLKSRFVILTLNSIFSALTCIPVYFSAKYSLGLRGAKAAAWAWAIYPFAIYFSADRVWEFALTAMLFTVCFCIVQQITSAAKPIAWLGFGVLYGITALSNPAVLSVLPFLLILALWRVRQSGGRWFLDGALTALGLVMIIMPWTIRNYRVVHVLCPIRDNFWLEFYAGNFGDTTDPNPAVVHPATSPVQMQKFLSMGEVAFMAEKHDLAINFVSHHPLFFVYVSLRRIVYYWTGFWSFSSQYVRREPFELPNMFFCGGVTLLMLRGARRFWRWNRTAALPYLVLIAVFPLTYYITHPLMDYRHPIEPGIIVLVVSGIFPLKRAKASEWIGAERAGLSAQSNG